MDRRNLAARISFRRLTRDDFPMVAGWLSQPHVARWWNHEFTAEAVERDFGASADGDEPNEDYVVLVDETAIGLIQYSIYGDYEEYREELRPLLDVPADAASIDYLIGDVAFVGLGFGGAMIGAFVERIWTVNPHASSIIVPVSAANEASWRALLSAGFRIVVRGELEPDNPIDDRMHVVLQLDRPTSAINAGRGPRKEGRPTGSR